MIRLKILTSCYACSPYQGSEPGMGWNFVSAISKHHELHIIVESQFAKPLNKKREEEPELFNNLHFYFIERERHRLLRKIWPPSYYWYYKKWQKKAFGLALKLEEKENFDLVHQLNMVGFREPGYLWKMNKPFVWGPIGGTVNTPWRFLPIMGIKGMIFYGFRNIINNYQKRYLKRCKQAATRPNSSLIAATVGDSFEAKKMWGKESIVIPEVGLNAVEGLTILERKTNEKFRILWSGQHTSGKALNILLKALSQCKSKNNLELIVLGKGEKTKQWRRLASQLHLENLIFWKGWLQKSEAVKMMATGHVFCITSLKDLTSTVLLEALSNGLPVVCLDHCGFSNVVNDTCGIKISLVKPKQSINEIALAIDSLATNEKYRFKLAQGAIKRAQEFNWDDKAKTINTIYHSLIS